jgi:hypothetical protein
MDNLRVIVWIYIQKIDILLIIFLHQKKMNVNCERIHLIINYLFPHSHSSHIYVYDSSNQAIVVLGRPILKKKTKQENHF